MTTRPFQQRPAYRVRWERKTCMLLELPYSPTAVEACHMPESYTCSQFAPPVNFASHPLWPSRPIRPPKDVDTCKAYNKMTTCSARCKRRVVRRVPRVCYPTRPGLSPNMPPQACKFSAGRPVCRLLHLLSRRTGFFDYKTRDSPESLDNHLRRRVAASDCRCCPKRKLVPTPGAAMTPSPPDPDQQVNRLFLCPAGQAPLRACKSRSRRRC